MPTPKTDAQRKKDPQVTQLRVQLEQAYLQAENAQFAMEDREVRRAEA